MVSASRIVYAASPDSEAHVETLSASGSYDARNPRRTSTALIA